MSKTLGMTTKQILYDISYMNAIMYSRTVPVYESKTEEKEDKLPYDDALDANDVSKFNDFEDEEIVRV